MTFKDDYKRSLNHQNYNLGPTQKQAIADMVYLEGFIHGMELALQNKEQTHIVVRKITLTKKELASYKKGLTHKNLLRKMISETSNNEEFNICD